jgi:thiamine biosynthesis protein ThiS
MITVNEDTTAWTPGMTVRDVLKVKNYKFPLLVITLDDVHVAPKDYDTTPVPDGAVVSVLHLLSGG